MEQMNKDDTLKIIKKSIYKSILKVFKYINVIII